MMCIGFFAEPQCRDFFIPIKYLFCGGGGEPRRCEDVKIFELGEISAMSVEVLVLGGATLGF